MPNYSVEKYSTGAKDSELDALADLETKLETIDNTKTIRLLAVIPRQGKYFVGVLIYDA